MYFIAFLKQNVQEKQLEKIRALEGEISSLQEEKKSWSLHRENIVEKSPDQVPYPNPPANFFLARR